MTKDHYHFLSTIRDGDPENHVTGSKPMSKDGGFASFRRSGVSLPWVEEPERRNQEID